MKKLGLLFICTTLIIALGCKEEEEVVAAEELNPPLGLYSITGDEKVTLFWYTSNYEENLSGYRIYQYEGVWDESSMDSIPSAFTKVDSLPVTGTSYDLRTKEVTGLINGTTYSFFIVAAMNDWSDLSYTSNVIHDTPREETAIDVTLDAKTTAGENPVKVFDLSDFIVVTDTIDYSDYSTTTGNGDILCETFNPGAGPRPWVDGINDGGIQDLGYMQDWNIADVAPTDGYAATGHSVEVIMGHVYAVKTGDNHCAKFQITGMDTATICTWIKFKAAYQPDPNNPEYK